MDRSIHKLTVFRKQGVERPTGAVKQSGPVWGVEQDNGSPTVLYTTCPAVYVDDIAELNRDDDAAERVEAAVGTGADAARVDGVMGEVGRGNLGTRSMWSNEEKRCLWKCYLSIGRFGKRDGYQKKVYDLYKNKKEKCHPSRTQQAVMQALRTIENGGLTKMEKLEIEQLVNDEQMKLFGVRQMGMDSGDETSPEFIGTLMGFDSCDETHWMHDDEGEVDDDIDFDVAAIFDDEEVGGGPKCSTPLPQPQNQNMLDAEPTMAMGGLNPDFEPVVYTWKESDGSVRVLTEDEKEVLHLLRKIRDDGEWKEVPNMRAVDRKKLMKEVTLVDGVMHNLLWQGMGVTQVNRLLYAGGVVVALRLGLKLGMGKKGKTQKPMWQRRIESSIVMWRKHLNQVEAIRKGSVVGEKVRKELDRKYQLTERGALCVSTFLKNKIQAGSTKIRWFEDKNGARRQNNLFRNNQRQLFKELNGDIRSTTEEIPDAAESKTFWENIWSVETEHDKGACWLGDIREQMKQVKAMDDVVVELDIVKRGIGTMTNWRAA